MSEQLESLRGLDDDAVIRRVEECVASERAATSRLLAALSELDVRRLYLGRGYGSLFDYCTRHLHLSERAAYGRIAAARLARRFPIILELIGDSRLSLTSVALLASHLNEANHRALLDEATHKSVREVEIIVARLAPKPDVASSVRKLPAPRVSISSDGRGAAQTGAVMPGSESQLQSQPEPHLEPPLHTSPQPSPPPQSPHSSAAPTLSQRAAVKPLAPERFKVQFTISAETREKLRAAQDYLRHSVPSGDVGVVFERALTALVSEIERTKMALVARPRATARGANEPRNQLRLIPAAVRRAVWKRDRGRCAFVGVDGRCRERAFLELHHVKPFAAGGEASLDNIALRCRAHNAHEADVYFGAPT